MCFIGEAGADEAGERPFGNALVSQTLMSSTNSKVEVEISVTSYTTLPIYDMTGVGDEALEPRLNPLEAYALVLGHRRLCANSVQILQKAQAIQGGLSQIDIKVIFIKMRQNHNFETWKIEGECFQESIIIPLNSTWSHSHLRQR